MRAPAAGLRDRFDAVVVGAGIVGLASAYYLARAGRRVLVVEQGPSVAAEASGRNGGHLSPTFDGPWAPLAQLALDTWPVLVAEVQAETGVDVEFRRDGGLYLTLADDGQDAAEIVAYRRERGFVAELVDPETCRRLVPGLTAAVTGGVFSPRHGQVNPILVTKALALAARRLGAETWPDTTFLGPCVAGDAITGALTTRGTVPAPVVVLAAGPWAALAADSAGLAVPVVPRRIQMVVSEAVPPLTGLVWGGNGLYARQARSGQLHFGAANPPWEPPVHRFDRSPSPVTLQRIARRMVELMPGLGAVRVLRTWAGVIGPSSDGLPILDAVPAPRGLIVATGFGGNGFVTGPAAGRVVAGLVADGAAPVDIAGLSLGRFSWQPGALLDGDQRARAEGLDAGPGWAMHPVRSA